MKRVTSCRLPARAGLQYSVALAAVFLLFNAAGALGQDCDPLKPNKPLDSQVSNETRANASALFNAVGTIDFENKFAKAQQDTLSKYPNADRVEVAEYHLYFLCELLRSSTTLSDSQKLDRFMDLVKVQNGLGGAVR